MVKEKTMMKQKTSESRHTCAKSTGRTILPVRRSLSLAASALALCLVALPASANWWSSSPSVTTGSRTINVRDAGALGNGRHDDTSAFQSAIDALPSSGGTITVPAGTYMIDALRSIDMRSHVYLRMSSGAKLVAIPNSSQRSNVITVWRANDVEISGGEIVGERVGHRGTSGEWGHGINILASDDVYVHDLKVSNCWGDGLYVGAIGRAGHATASTDVTINHVVSTNNRRQGLSFGPVNRVYVVNSTFSNTHGTAPEAGIDIEPSVQGTARHIRIANTAVTGNHGSGVELQDHVTDLVIKSSTIKGNHGFGIYSGGASDFWIAENLISENRLDGIAMKSDTHDGKITSNIVRYNSTGWFLDHGKSIYTKTSSSRDLGINTSTWGIQLAANTLSPQP